MTNPLDFEFNTQLLPQYKEYQLYSNDLCLNELKQFYYNHTWFINITDEIHSTMEQLNRPCEKIQRFEWMLEREYFVAITMGLLACFGLIGNLLSCIVIIKYLLKFSETFILFIFLSLADSLVIIMQTIDAYRNSVAVDFYTLISLDEISHPSNIWRRDWNCKLFLYFWHLSLQLSAWLVMALTIDRYASLKQFYITRSKRSIHCRAWLIGGGILAFLAFLNLPFLIYVKSVIYEMPCGHSHFCIFINPTEDRELTVDKEQTTSSKQIQTDELNHLYDHFVNGTLLLFSNQSFETNQTTDCKQLLGLHNLFSESVEAKQSKSSLFSIARNISIWLSHQHLIIFGFIPYTVTIIFNVLLIHYLRSLPWFHPKQKCGNEVYFKNNTKCNPELLMSLNKCCMSMFQWSKKCKSKKEKKKKSYDHKSNIQQSFIPCRCILRSENNPVIIGTTCSHSLNKRRQIHKFVKMFDHHNTNNHNQNMITMYCPISSHHMIPSFMGPHTWDGILNNYNDNNNNHNNKMELKHFQSSIINETPLNISRYSSCVSIKLDNSQSHLCSQHFDNDINNNDDGCPNNDENINNMHHYSQSKHGCNPFCNRQNTDIHMLLHKYRSNAVKTGWFVGQRRTTILLLVVTFTFIGLTLPYLIYVELKQFNVVDLTKAENYRPEHMAEELCRFLFFINNGLTFFIYMTGRQFRKGFYRLIHRFKSYLRSLMCPHVEKQNKWYSHPPNKNHTFKLIKPGKHYTFHRYSDQHYYHSYQMQAIQQQQQQQPPQH
uniref:G_PROTEIN_RECEP_F1_2 domain-containing protein n=1 Tax=Schistosoma mansoni TaxID=6183 RepID=A0A3Q0KVJ2_SCHMA